MNSFTVTGPFTDRSGSMLASYYGFESLEALAADIPANSEVVDLGAGNSTLGHEAANLRTDITWVNFDTRYSWSEDDFWAYEELTQQAKLKKLMASAPDNLIYLPGDIMEPPQELGINRFSRIFSYYMLPHIIDNGRMYGMTAVRNMFSLGSSEGILTLGPISDFDREANKFHIASEEGEIEKLVANIVDPWLERPLKQSE